MSPGDPDACLKTKQKLKLNVHLILDWSQARREDTYGVTSRILTCDPFFRKEVLYTAELWRHTG